MDETRGFHFHTSDTADLKNHMIKHKNWRGEKSVFHLKNEISETDFEKIFSVYEIIFTNNQDCWKWSATNVFFFCDIQSIRIFPIWGFAILVSKTTYLKYLNITRTKKQLFATNEVFVLISRDRRRISRSCLSRKREASILH